MAILSFISPNHSVAALNPSRFRLRSTSQSTRRPYIVPSLQSRPPRCSANSASSANFVSESITSSHSKISLQTPQKDSSEPKDANLDAQLDPSTKTEQKTPTPQSQPSEQPSSRYEFLPGEIGVRFINTPSGQEVLAAATAGTNLMAVGDSVGVRIPRSCQTGVCGTCTCDVLDPSAENGRQTVRACQTSAFAPDGSMELVVDVGRMKNAPKLRNPTSRFENLDTEYVAGAPPRRPGRSAARDCATCSKSGRIECYACDGAGEREGFDCSMCMGTSSLRCPDCEGDGTVGGKR